MRSFSRNQALAATITLLLLPSLRAQWSTNVSTADELAAAFAQAFNNNVADAGMINTINLTGDISSTSQWIVDANVNIVGNGNVINMNNADRAFFIAGGNVNISNLTIQNGSAVGGNSPGGGGGGAGLGGAIFVGSGTYYGGVDPATGIAPVAATGVSVPNVILSGVNFSRNRAIGGSVLLSAISNYSEGGGGMGGAGGSVPNPDDAHAGGGGAEALETMQQEVVGIPGTILVEAVDPLSMSSQFRALPLETEEMVTVLTELPAVSMVVAAEQAPMGIGFGTRLALAAEGALAAVRGYYANGTPLTVVVMEDSVGAGAEMLYMMEAMAASVAGEEEEGQLTTMVETEDSVVGEGMADTLGQEVLEPLQEVI